MSRFKSVALVVFALVLGLALGNVVSAMAGDVSLDREAFIAERQADRDAIRSATPEQREALIAERQAEREAFCAERQKAIADGEAVPGEGMRFGQGGQGFGGPVDGECPNPEYCPNGGVCGGTGLGMGGRGMGAGRGMGVGGCEDCPNL